MTKRLGVAAGVVATISLLVCAGCNRTTNKTPESSPEFQQIKTSLDASQKQNEQLSQDVQRLNNSLKEAESRLAETTKAKEGLQGQVQQLTASRGDLEAKVNELGKARVSLETRVNDLTKSRDDLQQTVESLTKAKNAALEDGAWRPGEGGRAQREAQDADPAGDGPAGADQDDSVGAGAAAEEAGIVWDICDESAAGSVSRW